MSQFAAGEVEEPEPARVFYGRMGAAAARRDDGSPG